MPSKVNVGLIGCGSISAAYIKGCQQFKILNILACADIDAQRAASLASEYDIPKPCSVEELLADPDVQIVLNLTPPAVHSAISLEIIRAGKHVYSEKPLAISRSEGLDVLTAAERNGVLVGCAPDTFLGSAFQTCRELIDEGKIGDPVAANAFMISHGWEHWHPNPHFHYQIGGGPMFDMGPYYLASLVSLLGPINRVTGSTRATFDQRHITSQPHQGETVTVEVPTHVAGIFDFANGAIGTIITTFDVWASELPRLEIHGTEGSLNLPDPNMYGGPVRLIRGRSDTWEQIPHSHSYHPEQYCRGIGVADLAYAAFSDRVHRASGDLAYHILDVMIAFDEASRLGKHVDITSTCQRPAPLPLGLGADEWDP